MASGPSREELQMYWQNSRQYFEELARHYQQADPEYYKQNILPFYSNPLYSVSSGKGKQGSGGVKLMVVMALVVVIGVAGAAFFLLMEGTDTKHPTVKENTKTQRENVKEVEPVPESSPEEDTEMLSPEDNFIIGSKYLGEKKYDKAEYHFKQIKPGQKYYREAQDLLRSMKYLK